MKLMAENVIPENRLKKTLKGGGAACGTMIVELRQPAVMKVLANAGLDMVIIDGEHGPFTIETIGELCRAARSAGVTPIVRVPDISYTYVTQPLDAGAQGIMIPRVTDARSVHEAIQMMKYPPVGRRGVVLARGHTEFRAGPLVQALKDANEESLLIVQIETVQALDHLEEIIAVPGVDVALVGPTDLSVAMGVPGQQDHPKMQAAVEKVIGACKNAGVVPAIHTNILDQGVFWARKGMRLVSFNSELGLLGSMGTVAARSLRESFSASGG